MKSIFMIVLFFMTTTFNAQDWANLEQFKANNMKIGLWLFWQEPMILQETQGHQPWR